MYTNCTRHCNLLLPIGKRLLQALLAMNLLLAATPGSYAQSPTDEELTNHLFLPLVANAIPQAVDEQVAVETEATVDPTEDLFTDYDAILAAETEASVSAAGSNQIFLVTKTADTNDGVCSPSDCSLREAAAVAAADPTTHDTILLFPGSFLIMGQPLRLVNVSLLGEGVNKTLIIGENVNTGFKPPLNTIEIPMALALSPLKPLPNTWVQLEQLSIHSGSLTYLAAGIKHSWGRLNLKHVRVEGHPQGIYSAPPNWANSKGIFLYNSDINLNGQGIVIDQGSGYLEDSIVRNSKGLGLNLTQSSVTLVNTTISSNMGSGLALFKSTGDIFSSALIFNKKGAIDLNQSTLSMTNSTLSSNGGAEPGAGLSVDGAGSALLVGGGSTANLTFVTIAKNKVPETGAGLYVSPYGTNTVNMSNSIVADSSMENGPTSDCRGAIQSGGGNLIENTTGCTLVGASGDISGVDALLGILTFNGGKTKNHKPLIISPAVDVIQGAACPNFSLDQRDIIRPRDGNGDGIWGCDMGAVER